MIALNPNPKVIQARLGHSTISTTFDLYGHLLPGTDEDLAVGLNELYRSAATKHRPQPAKGVLS
jgi:integrase